MGRKHQNRDGDASNGNKTVKSDLVLRDMEDGDSISISRSGHAQASNSDTNSSASGVETVFDKDSDSANHAIPMDVSASSNTPPLLPLNPNSSTGTSNDYDQTQGDVLSLSGTLDSHATFQNNANPRRNNAGGPVVGSTGLTAGSRPLTPAVTTAGSSAGLVSSTAINSNFTPGACKQGEAATLYARYKELLGEKREMKRVLKKFDEDFALKHSRPPQKAEKEVMRPMYQKYHEIKHDMDVLRNTIETKHGPMPSDDEQDDKDKDSGSEGGVFGDVKDDNKRRAKHSSSANLTSPAIAQLLASPPTKCNVSLVLSTLK